MGLPNDFNDIIQKHLNLSAAWLPMAQIYSLGDYGVIADGVFARLGNIKEFGIEVNGQPGTEVSIDFTSDSATVSKFSGGAQVSVIPAGSVDARIAIKFEKGKSFIVKSPVIKATVIANVRQVADKLKNASGWKRKWKVVYELYDAQEAVVISTIDAATEISFSGNATALKDLKLGSAGVDFSSNKKLGLEVHGKAGVLALGLFKLKLVGGGPAFPISPGEQELEFEDLKGKRLKDDF